MATTQTPRKRGAKRAPRKAGTGARTVSDSHKEAMAQGRREGAAVARYLDALKAANAAKKRGRKRDPESLRVRIEAVEIRLQDANVTSLTHLQLTQQKLDLQNELASLNGDSDVNPDDYADDFVAVVKGYSERKGITKAAWRNVGVPAALLTKAGVR